MYQDKYSIKDIQHILHISSNNLQKLLQDEANNIDVEIVSLPNGEKEYYIDSASFERLMFLKLIRFGRTPFSQELDIKRERSFILEEALENILREMYDLQNSLNEIALKYDKMNCELNRLRLENAVLKEENTKLRITSKAIEGEEADLLNRERVATELHKLH